jgi:hypothetical protein
MKKIIITTLSILAIHTLCFAQTVTQTVKGSILNPITQEGLIGATIMLLDSDPIIGTATDVDGTFELKNVPVGRQSFEVSMVGYEKQLIQEVLVSSGKEVILEIILKEKFAELDEIVVVSKREKDKAINSMATLSSRQFTVEETQRYAGGLNDPARLVSSFAGVATPSISSNGISVRGNSPAGLLWRIEGVEVPSPNHFANLNIAGAGLLTVLSSQMMGNSDFYLGAFPSEYGNASSGVFDINLRTGNASKREYTFQAGLTGIDFATEGPFKDGKDASYLFNYRYSSLALVSAFLPDDAGVLKYQDLSFKLNMPTENKGTFSLWGMGAYDAIDTEALEPEEWESVADMENSQTSLYLFATGLNHKVAVKSNAFLKTAFTLSGNGLSHTEQRLDPQLVPQPKSDAQKNNYKLTLQSALTSYWGDSHTNRTGFYVNLLGYDLDIDHITAESLPINIVNQKGQSSLFQLYSQSKFKLTSDFTLNAGFHAQYFQLNKALSFEPRIAVNYQLNEKNRLGLAYGLHSQTESLPIYFVKNSEGSQPNKELDLMKSNHLVLSFSSMLKEHIKLSIEPYYQFLTDVPVAPDSYISIINTQDNLFFDHALVSEGTGRNIGIDITLERYLNKGLYYLFSTSVFDSKYTANDGIERNTRYNKNYIVNALIGKEWQVGKSKNNLLSANLRLSYIGGNRIETVDSQQSINAQDIVYGEADGKLAFAEKHKDAPILSFTISYRKNKAHYSSIWALQLLNATQTEEFETDIFNLKTQSVEQKFGKIMVPNLSYKIEF